MATVDHIITHTGLVDEGGHVRGREMMVVEVVILLAGLAALQ